VKRSLPIPALLFAAFLVLGSIALSAGQESAAPASVKRGAGARTEPSQGRSSAEVPRVRLESRAEIYRVKRVIDGDTFRLDNDERVRLLGVDTPETKHPKKPIEYYGPEASAFTKREIEKRLVLLEFDRTPRDRYGRVLAYVFRQPDEFFLNAELLKQGYAYAYTRFPFARKEEFLRYEEEARKAGRGLWAPRPEASAPPAAP
jgi:micrococcal nuclease